MTAGSRKGRWALALMLMLALLPVGLKVALTPRTAHAAPRGYRKPLALGPVVQNVDQTSASLAWGTNTECLGHAKVRATDGKEGEQKLQETGVLRIFHRVRVKGLRPDTKYLYDVSDCVGRWHSGSFRTAVSQNQPFTFLVYGDCRSHKDRHLSVVESMLEEKAAFAVNTGDMVADGAKLHLWYQFFRIERPLLRHLPVYPVLGNHELQGSWKRGITAFRRYFEVPANGPEKGITYSFVYGNSLFLVLNSNASFVATTQTAWARAQLEAAASNPAIRHTFVFMHHSPYASGIHGENDDAQIAGLPRILTKYGTDALFAGHDHVYERGEADGLRYIISGGCGAPLYPRRKINNYTAWFESTTHFVRITVRGDEVEYAALRPGGSLIDSFKYIKRPATPATPGHPATPHQFLTLADTHPRPMPMAMAMAIPQDPRWPPKTRTPPPPSASGQSTLILATSLVSLALLTLLGLYLVWRSRRKNSPKAKP